MADLLTAAILLLVKTVLLAGITVMAFGIVAGILLALGIIRPVRK